MRCVGEFSCSHLHGLGGGANFQVWAGPCFNHKASKFISVHSLSPYPPLSPWLLVAFHTYRLKSLSLFTPFSLLPLLRFSFSSPSLLLLFSHLFSHLFPSFLPSFDTRVDIPLRLSQERNSLRKWSCACGQSCGARVSLAWRLLFVPASARISLICTGDNFFCTMKTGKKKKKKKKK
jgi:hypothetical protein